ncbi:hypothetical protein ACFLT1_04430 [Bacteroidota bacterium]
MLYLGIFLILYAVAVFLIAGLKPAKIWNMGKIQGFVKILGDLGTVIFFIIWGLIGLGFGIWLTIANWPA